MNTDLRIPVTADQKRLITEAIADEPGGLAAWAREVLIRAAADRAGQKERLQPSGDACGRQWKRKG